ncbi:hypothetical protein EJ05DRAFT_290738 [Pseudovirgaria hyperparasitica]|uniref:Gag1-like clamp domain-containing protein n=1 Tax=Pseudovirgaria hyperparasitica TaxID=470096 RepID=A0A6A6WHI5_9PEZI|nr:uncharacterized protein EJ05DRAFT_290738 [Pseudovirgaria hyperparasitica]KAF2760611.1 hypothetical protein EJ05DRAFT_290738 [Pseudovirgaria hyperparasitica]
MDTNQSAARQARRFYQDNVRNDWVWPNPPRPKRSDDELKGVSEFRERFYGTPSESESETSLQKKSSGEAYKFDSPDSVGLVVAANKEEKMRKRRKDLEEEMSWNEGLAVFEARRDQWTGAAAARSRISKAKKLQSRVNGGERKASQAESSKSPADSGTEVTSHYFADSHSTCSDPHAQEILVPVAPRLLAQNAIRISIGEKVYPDIYNKVVLSARTPSVPINLSDMTKALVQGWKEHGEWPPRPAPPDPLAGRRKSSIGQMLGGLGRMRSDEPFLNAHPHVRKGVESVKKVFRMSGSQGSGSSNSPVPKE